MPDGFSRSDDRILYQINGLIESAIPIENYEFCVAQLERLLVFVIIVVVGQLIVVIRIAVFAGIFLPYILDGNNLIEHHDIK